MNKQKEAPYQFYKIQAIVWISLISATHTSMGMGPSTGVWETNLWKRTQEWFSLPQMVSIAKCSWSWEGTCLRGIGGVREEKGVDNSNFLYT